MKRDGITSGTRSLRVLAGMLAFFSSMVACGGGADDGGGGDELSGTILVSGSSTVQPITSLVAELFREENGGVAITVDGPGTGDGFELFCAGQTDVSDASRAIDEEEAAACGSAGVEYVEMEVALDGVTVMTNPDNSVACLSTGDLYALFGPESTGFDTWNGAAGLAAELGGSGDFPDHPLEITAPGEESGTYDAFIELAGIADMAEQRGLPEDEIESLRADYQSSPDDNVIIQAMETSPSALGFVGYAFAQSAGDRVKEIAIDGGDGCVAPDTTTIADGTYPLSRSLYIYVNTAKANDNPALAAFIDQYLTSDGLNMVVERSGYVPIPAERQEAVRSTWEAATA
ncbi:MAG TPA: substrate-binding domain-containing protein [Actinomycetota bacterium]|nr:substrate-binding domain-containing protein [Actinomycetota bacterium]